MAAAKMAPWRESRAWRVGVHFYRTGQELVAKMRRMLELRRRDPASLSREESALVRRTVREMRQALPALVLFFVPVIGYSVPLLSYFKPRVLPRTMWLPSQRSRLELEDHVVREEARRDLLALLHREARLRGAQSGAPLAAALAAAPRLAPASELVSLRLFCEAALPLHALPRRHLELAVHTIRTYLVPLAVVPSPLLRRRLERFAQLVQSDAQLIEREGGPDSLAPEELALSCSERGAPISSARLLHALNLAALPPAAPPASSQPLAASYLIHAHAVLNAAALDIARGDPTPGHAEAARLAQQAP